MKKWNWLIGLILVVTLLFSGCVPSNTKETGNMGQQETPVQQSSFQTVFASQEDLVGEWTIDATYTKEFTGKDLQTLYGTAFGTYGCGMEFGVDGSFSYFIAVGTGGQGAYTVSEGNKFIDIHVTEYEGEQAAEFAIWAVSVDNNLRLMMVDGKELIFWKKNVAAEDTVAATPVITPTPTLTPTQTPVLTLSPEWMVAGFPIVYQNPELPTGCEITAMTMLLNYYGYDVDKVTMATKYLPTTKIGTWKGKDGKTYGPDLYHYFAGNPAGTGITCGAGAIETAADRYLETVGSDLRAVDISGTPAHDLFAYVSQNMPVFLCATIGMEDRRSIKDSWYTEEGELMDWSTNDHGVVLIGYNSNEVTVADPIHGRVTCSREQFEKVYEQRGRQAVVLVADTQNSATLE